MFNVAVGLAAVLITFAGVILQIPLVAAGVLLGMFALVTAATKHATVQLFMVTTFLLLPMNGLRVSGITFADIALLCAFVFALVERKWTPIPAKYGVPLYGLILIATLASVFSPFQAEALASVARLAIASALCIQLVFLVKPAAPQIEAWIWAFASGNGVSVIYGYMFPPEYSDRINGLTTHANTLGLVSSLALLLLLTRTPAGLLLKILWALLLGLSAAGAIASGSRAALLSVGVGVLVRVCFSPRPGRAWAVFLSICVVGVLPLALWQVTIPGSAMQRLFETSNFEAQSNTGRLIHADYALERWSDQPLLGAGMDIGVVAHNVYLQLLTAAGPIGLLSFLAIVLTACIALVKTLRRPGVDAETARIALGILSATLGYLTSAAVSNNLWDRFVWLVLGLALFVGSRVFTDRFIRDEPTTLSSIGRISTRSDHVQVVEKWRAR